MRGKRSAGEGSIRKLPSGTWVGQVMDGYTDDGKRRMRNFSAPTKTEVLDKIRTFHMKKDQPVDPQVPDISFAEWADRWCAASITVPSRPCQACGRWRRTAAGTPTFPCCTGRKCPWKPSRA